MTHSESRFCRVFFQQLRLISIFTFSPSERNPNMCSQPTAQFVFAVCFVFSNPQIFIIVSSGFPAQLLKSTSLPSACVCACWNVRCPAVAWDGCGWILHCTALCPTLGTAPRMKCCLTMRVHTQTWRPPADLLPREFHQNVKIFCWFTSSPVTATAEVYTKCYSLIQAVPGRQNPSVYMCDRLLLVVHQWPARNVLFLVPYLRWCCVPCCVVVPEAWGFGANPSL